jgi:hypothetical protein
MEHEIIGAGSGDALAGSLDDLERQLRHLDAEISDKQTVLRSLQKLEEDDGFERRGGGRQAHVKELLDKLRARLRASVAEHTRLEAELDAAFNPHWGPLFREGREISKFGEQVEAYACVYTSRVSNFRFYSPNRHFRGPRDSHASRTVAGPLEPRPSLIAGRSVFQRGSSRAVGWTRLARTSTKVSRSGSIHSEQPVKARWPTRAAR